MPDRRAVGVVFDGGLAGLLTVVHAYYYDKLLPVELHEEASFQSSLGTDYVHIATNEAKAETVLEALRKKLSQDSVSNIFNAMLHESDERFMSIFQYIIAGFHYLSALDSYEQLDYVLAMHKMVRHVNSEAHLLKGFVRFTKTPDGVYYADISPKNEVLHVLAAHFAERLGGERWIIHDVRHKLAAVYDTKEWIIMEAPAQAANPQRDDADGYGALWSAFYDSIMIQERANPKCRRSHMPKYFWKHMTEHKAVLDKYREEIGEPPRSAMLPASTTVAAD